MIIRGYELDVDVEEELELYIEEFSKVRVRGHKLQACSPFRDEKHPSFAVNLENGTFIDSGSDNEEWRKGNFTKLLAYLQGVTYEETEDFLINKYKTILEDVDTLSLDVELERSEALEYVPMEEIQQFAYRHPYLKKRGISEKTQKAFKIGYDKTSKAVVFVWTDKHGRPVNLKFRKIDNKIFWYRKGGQPIKNNIYGLQFIHRLKSKEAVVVESETDALYLWSNGYPAIALGSASMSKKQESLILGSPIEKIVLGFDRDTAGNRASLNVRERLLGRLHLYNIAIPKDCKDINDIPSNKLINVLENKQEIIPQFSLQR